jgi:hypothetical protein
MRPLAPCVRQLRDWRAESRARLFADAPSLSSPNLVAADGSGEGMRAVLGPLVTALARQVM